MWEKCQASDMADSEAYAFVNHHSSLDFIAFFANDIYGFVSWRKMKTRQQEITNVVSIM